MKALLVLLLVSSPIRAATTETLAVFPLEAKTGVSQATADILSEILVEELRRPALFSRVVSPREIDVLVGPTQRQQIMQCAANECAVVDEELAGGLGVSHLFVGHVAKLGGTYVLTARVFELRTASEVASIAEQIPGTSEDALLQAIRPAVQAMLKRWKPNAFASSPAPSTEASGGAGKAISPLLAVGVGIAGLGALLVVPAVLAFVASGLVGLAMYAPGIPPPPTGLKPDQKRIVIPVVTWGFALTGAAVLVGALGMLVAGGMGAAIGAAQG